MAKQYTYEVTCRDSWTPFLQRSKQEVHSSYASVEDAKRAITTLYDDLKRLVEHKNDYQYEVSYEFRIAKKPMLKGNTNSQRPSLVLQEQGHGLIDSMLSDPELCNMFLEELIRDEHRCSEMTSRVLSTHEGFSMAVAKLVENPKSALQLAVAALDEDPDVVLRSLDDRYYLAEGLLAWNYDAVLLFLLEDKNVLEHITTQVLRQGAHAIMDALVYDPDVMHYLAGAVVEDDFQVVLEALTADEDTISDLIEKVVEVGLFAVLEKMMEESDVVETLVQRAVENNFDAVMDRLIENSDSASEVVQETIRCDREKVIDKLVKVNEGRQELVQQLLEGSESRDYVHELLMADDSHRAEFMEVMDSDEDLRAYLEAEIKEEYKKQHGAEIMQQVRDELKQQLVSEQMEVLRQEAAEEARAEMTKQMCNDTKTSTHEDHPQ